MEPYKRGDRLDLLVAEGPSKNIQLPIGGASLSYYESIYTNGYHYVYNEEHGHKHVYANKSTNEWYCCTWDDDYIYAYVLSGPYPTLEAALFALRFEEDKTWNLKTQ